MTVPEISGQEAVSASGCMGKHSTQLGKAGSTQPIIRLGTTHCRCWVRLAKDQETDLEYATGNPPKFKNINVAHCEARYPDTPYLSECLGHTSVRVIEPSGPSCLSRGKAIVDSIIVAACANAPASE